MLPRLTLAVALLAGATAIAEQPCFDCWTKQCPEYRGMIPACTGQPAAPTPKAPPQAAKCPAGSLRTPDTHGNCCWPGQAWSSARQSCVGTPTSCPPGTRVEGELCTAQQPKVDGRAYVEEAQQCASSALQSAAVAEHESQETAQHARLAIRRARANGRGSSRAAERAEVAERRAMESAQRAMTHARQAESAAARARTAGTARGADAQREAQFACQEANAAQAEAQEAAQNSDAARAAAEDY